MKMPKILWVRIDEYGTDVECVLAYDALEDAIDGDGPTTVGVYKLADTIKRKKAVVLA